MTEWSAERVATVAEVCDALMRGDFESATELEQALQEAEAEAQDLAAERYELEQRPEAEAEALNQSLAELEDLDARHRAALRRAGRPVGHSNSLKGITPRWFGHRFGGFNSTTGVLGSHPGSGKNRPLHARDPLAQERPGYAEGKSA